MHRATCQLLSHGRVSVPHVSHSSWIFIKLCSTAGRKLPQSKEKDCVESDMQIRLFINRSNQLNRMRTTEKTGNMAFLQMPNFLCYQGSNSACFIPKQDHSNQQNKHRLNLSILLSATYRTLLSQTEANTEDVLASLQDSQRLYYCIDGLLKTEKKNVKFQLNNILHVLKIMPMGKLKSFLNYDRERLTKK